MIPTTENLSPLESALPPLPNSTSDQTNQSNKASFDPPENWGTLNPSSVVTIQPSSTPQHPSAYDLQPTISNPTPESDTSPSVLKIILISLALILLGVLLGVLAGKFFQPPAVSPNLPLVSTPTPQDTIIVTPSATPSALLNLTWKNYTTPNYNLSYPSTWVLKNSVDKLTLIKDKNIISVLNKAEIKGGGCEGKSVYQVNKTDFVWDLQEASSSSLYRVCEVVNDSSPVTQIGEVTLRGSQIDQATLDEFKYILEKIVFTKPSPTICGGFAGLLCPSGYSCVVKDTYPDASGTCIAQ